MKRMVLIAALALVSARADGQTKELPYPPRDAARPVSLPAVTRYVPDKPYSGDPVTDASRALVTGGNVTVRPAAAAYQRWTVADPFENRQLVRPRPPIAEEAAPPLILPRK
jgi:hypothetical protein